MNNEQILKEMESLVEAIGQSMSILSGTIAEERGPGAVLRQMLAAKGAAEDYYGPNQWRDRLVRDMLRIVAMKARPEGVDDPLLQTLIASVLEAPVGRHQKN